MKAGITGHQKLSSDIVDWVNIKLPILLNEYKINYGYSSLAVGADQLFVNCLKSLNASYTFVLPSKSYEETFNSKVDLVTYIKLKSESTETIELNYSKPTEEAFYEAGKKIVDLSDIIFAIWDGKKAKGLGGTADIVDYSKKSGKQIIHLDTVKKIVLIIKP